MLVALLLAVAGLLFWRGTRDIFSLVRLASIVPMVAGLAAVAARRRANPAELAQSMRMLGIAAGAYVLVFGVAAVRAQHLALGLLGPYGRYNGFLLAASGIVMAAVLALRANWRDIARLLNLHLMFVAAAVVYGLLQVAGVDPFDWPGADLSTRFSTFGQVNFASAYAGMASPIALAWVLRDQRAAVRVASATLLVGLTAYLAAVDSFQGPVVAAVGCLVVLGAHFGPRVVGGRRIIVPLVSGAGLVVGVAAVSLFHHEIQGGLAERRLLWRAALEMFSDHPLWGHGIGGYHREFISARPVEHAMENGLLAVDAPHNVVLDHLVSGGLLLAVVYVVVVGLVAVRLFSSLHQIDGDRRLVLAGIAGAWSAYQLQSLVSIDVPSLAILHWFLAGSALACGGLLQGSTSRTRRSSRINRSVLLAPAALLAGAGAWLVAAPLRADVHADRGADEFRTGDLTAALAALQDAAESAPWEAVYRADLASAASASNNGPLALEAGGEAADRAPGEAKYSLSSASVAANLGENGVATAWIDRAVTTSMNDPAVLVQASNLLRGMGEVRRAMALAEAAVDRAPGYALAHLQLGLAQEAAGRRGAAEAALSRALELDPDNVEARSALARVRELSS